MGLWDLQPQYKRKGRNPYATKRSPTITGLRLSSQRYGSQGGSHLCKRPHVAAKIDDHALNKGAARLTPISFCASDTIVRYESPSGPKHGLATRRTRSHSSPFPRYFNASFNLRDRPFLDRISRIMLVHKDPSGRPSLPA